MSSLAYDPNPAAEAGESRKAEEPARDEVPAGGAPADLRPVPRISVQAFCETPETAKMMESASIDRRMSKAHVKVHMGGIAAAVDFYGSAPTPNLIVIECSLPANELIEHLDGLAEVCDPGSKVVIIGHVNDVTLYRDLIHRGVSEYLVAPVSLFQLVATIGDLYTDPTAEPLGRTIAFVGAKGGCGASTVAHNVAWSIARLFENDVVLADLDLAFGTAGLDFNQDPLQGIMEAISAPERLDETFLDRLLSKCTDQLSLLAAPASLEKTYDHDEKTFDSLIEVMRKTTPSVVMDMPHSWTNWTRHLIGTADEIVIVAEPDLANLRNAKNLLDTLRQMRPNDSRPHLVLNRVNVPKRPEIKPEEFTAALDLEPAAAIPFDPQLFGTAANNGQMIGELDPKHQSKAQFDLVSQIVTGRSEVRKPKGAGLNMLMARFLKKRKGAAKGA
ncbi:AAA family ATPase [Stappia sp. GBMRC 2046]|uniref:AAA family ATPase n=1 Tax=Stappia sediminis TaxID=2692190 RepID=A0A7X3S931_9HYPH|nr:CpaE family protein [Stappia sediminis]MXN66419.1 AAA family ATPase [Stappia sediminis]